MNKKTNISWKDFFAGAFLSAILCIFLFSFSDSSPENVIDTNVGVSEKSEDTPDNTTQLDDGSTITSYNTGIKDWKMKTGDKELTFNTPDDFYSLSDQYVDNLKEYYSVDEIDAKNLVIVGNNTSLYEASTVINASTLSGVSSMLNQIYDDDFNEEDIISSEAYTYMTTGSLPKELPLNYKIDEVATYTIEDVNFIVYEVNYDTEYTNNTVSSNDAGDVTTVHTQQLACYSDTEDAIEIILYQTEFDRENALTYLEQFLGVN